MTRRSSIFVPLVYLALWSALVVFLGAVGLRGSAALLFSETTAAVPEPAQAPATAPVPATAPAPVMLPAPEPAPVQVHVRSGRREISHPAFDTAGTSFTCSYDLGVAPAGGFKILRQDRVSAWMVDVPGTWRVIGPASTASNHPLISSVLVLVNASRARFKIYYRDPRHSPGQQPEVRLTDRGISITINE